MRSVCVYCASSIPENPALVAATRQLGSEIAARELELVYGGGSVGLMGLVADTVLASGGRVTGVIPTSLFPVEVGHGELTELVEVASMHERKAEMIRRSDAFVALPGGFGTLEEIAEVLTWAQIGLHAKPAGFLNVDGFFDSLLAFFDRCVTDGVLKEKNRRLVIAETNPELMLDALENYRAEYEPKWFDLDTV